MSGFAGKGFSSALLIVKKVKLTVLLLACLFLVLIVGGLVLQFSVNTIDSCFFPESYKTGFGNENKLTIIQKEVKATNPNWTATNIPLSEGDTLELKVSGEVNMCLGTHNPNQNLSIIPLPFSSTENKWQPTGVYVVEGLPFSMEVTKEFSQFPSSTCENDTNPAFSIYQNDQLQQVFDINEGTRIESTGRWIDTESNELPCYSTSGRGLFIHIGEPEDGLDSTEFGNAEFEGKGDRFFEFFKYNDAGALSSSFNQTGNKLQLDRAPASGQIYLRYGEVGDANGAPFSGPWRWPSASSASDNRGGYDVEITSKCTATSGRNLIAYIGKTAPSSSTTEGTFLNLDAVAQLDNLPEFNYQGEVANNGKLYFRIMDVQEGTSDATGDGNYSTNGGSYNIQISYNERKEVNKLLNALIEPVKILLHGAKDANGQQYPGVPEAMFKAISINGQLTTALRACMVLAIVLYAFKFVTSGAGGSVQELIEFSVKLGIIIALISDTSWDFFYNYLFQGVMGAVDQISSLYMMAMDPSKLANTYGGLLNATDGGVYEFMDSLAVAGANDISNVFGFLGIIISFIVDGQTWPRILSLITHSLFGIFLFLVVLVSIVLFFMTVYRCLLTYLSSMIFLALLIGAGPIFIGFILFNYTKKFAHSWFRAILFYVLQPILLLCLVSIFANIFYGYLYKLLDFAACYECIYNWPIPLIGGHICLIANYKSWVASGSVLVDTANDGIFALSLYVVASAMYKLPDLAYAFSYRLAGVAAPDTVGKNAEGKNTSMSAQMGIDNQTVLGTATGAAANVKKGVDSGKEGVIGKDKSSRDTGGLTKK